MAKSGVEKTQIGAHIVTQKMHIIDQNAKRITRSHPAAASLLVGPLPNPTRKRNTTVDRMSSPLSTSPVLSSLSLDCALSSALPAVSEGPCSMPVPVAVLVDNCSVHMVDKPTSPLDDGVPGLDDDITSTVRG